MPLLDMALGLGLGPAATMVRVLSKRPPPCASPVLRRRDRIRVVHTESKVPTSPWQMVGGIGKVFRIHAQGIRYRRIAS